MKPFCTKSNMGPKTNGKGRVAWSGMSLEHPHRYHEAVVVCIMTCDYAYKATLCGHYLVSMDKPLILQVSGCHRHRPTHRVNAAASWLTFITMIIRRKMDGFMYYLIFIIWVCQPYKCTFRWRCSIDMKHVWPDLHYILGKYYVQFIVQERSCAILSVTAQ